MWDEGNSVWLQVHRKVLEFQLTWSFIRIQLNRLLTWPLQRPVGGTVSFQTYLGLTISSLTTYLQSWAAKVVRFYNIWYVDSAASEGRTGATWEPQEPEASSTPIEQGKNKTGFHEVVRSPLQAEARKPSIRNLRQTRWWMQSLWTLRCSKPLMCAQHWAWYTK